LTRQLLAFSRRQVLQPRVVSLNRVVLDMQAILRRLIGEDIHLISYLSDDEPRARVDVGQLEQVVLNLAVNARDAMPQGGRLTLETAIAEVTGDESDLQLTVAPGRYVLLRMTDTGVGMDDAILSRIFEPFFTTKGQGKGTGLGLATVYGIVSQSGGGVVVRSRPQLGTTFEVYLPQVTAPEELEPASSRAPAPALTAAAPRTVLVVEDDDRVRAVAERVVHLTGCQPLAAPDGHTALTLAERHGPELALVLTDVKMPSMSGHELVRRLREAAPQLPVVFMSGYAQELLDSVDLMDGLTRFIAKPFTPGQLAQCIQEALGQPLRGSAARSS
jgi:two-component system cell cycle sensor histidine kinase/response regulator CckA